MEVLLKTLVVALGCASLLATAVPAAAESSQHGGFSHGGSGAQSGGRGGFARGGAQGAGFAGRGFGAGHFAGGFRPGFRGFRGYPYYFADFGLGFALGLSVLDPWYWDGGPYYGGYYYGYPPYGPPPGGYYAPPPPSGGYPAPPPAASGAPAVAGPSQAPAACGSWKWDTDKQTYNWIPC
jgi:hypothetical protein